MQVLRNKVFVLAPLAIALWFALAGSAHADATEALPAVPTGVEAAPEAEATVGAVVEEATEVAPSPPPEPAPEPVVVPEPVEAVGTVEDVAAEVAAPVEAAVEEVQTDPAGSAAPTVDQVERLAQSPDPAGVLPETLKNTPPVERISDLTEHAAASVVEPLRALSESVGPVRFDVLPPAGGAQATPGGRPFPAPTRVPLPGKSGHLTGASLTGAGEVAPTDPTARSFVGTAGAELSRLPVASGDPNGPQRTTLAPASGNARFGAVQERSGGRAPLDAPAAPGSPQTATGSPGGSFFPFAALLALLALVAPAIHRRLGEAPDFRAPTPFVCGLERPG